MYMVIMNREDEYDDDDSRRYNIVVTDKEDTAKKICESLNDLVNNYKSYLKEIVNFKNEYSQKNPKPYKIYLAGYSQKQVTVLDKNAPAYDDEYMITSKHYPACMRLANLNECDFQSAIDRWSDELDQKLQEKFSAFKFENFKYYELLEERYSQFDEHCSFFYQEIQFIKS